MTLKTTDRVATAPNAQAAMIELAAGIDVILTHLQSKPSLGWDEWGQYHEPPAATRVLGEAGTLPFQQASIDERSNERSAAIVREQLAAATDPDDVRALEARLRLLTDTGSIPDGGPTEGARVRTTESADAITVELAPPTPERMASRVVWAQSVNLPDYLKNLTVDEVLRGFALGGPQWLYLGDRDAVMALSLDARRWLVNDLEKDSPAEAHEMGRDVLKADFENSRDAAQEHLLTGDDA